MRLSKISPAERTVRLKAIASIEGVEKAGVDSQHRLEQSDAQHTARLHHPIASEAGRGRDRG